MPRNKINSNQRIFSRLKDRAADSSRQVDHLSEARWIGTNDDEKNWLTDSKVEEISNFSRRVKTARFSFLGKNYFAAVGFEQQIEDNEIFVPINLNAGIGTALIDELDVPVVESTDPLKIINEVLALHKGCGGYAGHDFRSIANFFEPVLIYEISPDSPIKADDLTRLSFSWILGNGERIILPLSNKTREQIENLAATGAASVPFDVLLNCIQSAQWPHAFLEAYRCVERLFSFQVIEDLHKELAIPISLLSFAEKIENAIGWRPREEQAIERIFTLLPADAQALMETVKDQFNPTEKIHGWVYDLRNSVVHFRPATRQLNLSDRQWDEMIRATFLLIGKLYGAYDHHLKAA
jgi:hypothetical protein